jgi:hypothetical protein
MLTRLMEKFKSFSDNFSAFQTVSSFFQPDKKRIISNKKLFQGKIVALLPVFLLLYSVAQSATITSTAAGGNWATGFTWVGGVAPASGDVVIIATTGAGAVQITASITQTAPGSVTVNNGAKLTTSINRGTITLGSLTILSGGMATIYSNLIVTGVTNISGTINFGSTARTLCTMTFTGPVTLNSGSAWNETTTGAAAAFTISNNFTNHATSFTAQAALHTFNAAGTLSGSTITTIPNASFTANYINTGTLTVTSTLRVTGAAIRLTNNGVVTVNSSLTGTGGVINSATGFLNLGGTSSITFLSNAGTTNITGPGAITTAVANFTNTGTLNISGSGTISGITNSTGGVVNHSGSSAISSFNNATSTSVLNISTTPVIPVFTILTAGAAGNTVNYTGVGAQNIKDATYGNLTIAGSGTKTWTLTGNRTVGGILSVGAGAILATAGNFMLGVTTISGAGGLINAATLNLGGASSIAAFTNTKTTNITGPGAITTSVANFINTGALNIRGTGLISGITNNAGGIVNHSGLSAITSFNNATSTSKLNISTTPTIPVFNTLTVSVAGNTVNYSGAGAQNIMDISYGGNLTISGSGTKSWVLTGNRTVGGTLSVGTGAILATTGSFPLGVTALSGAGSLINAAILNLGGTSSISVLSNAGTTNITGSGAITTNVTRFTNTGTLTISGSGTITGITNNAGGKVNHAGSSTITSFNNATSTSTLNISTSPITPTFTSLTASIAGNTVNYNGAGAQSIKDISYGGNLIISGSGTKTWTLTANRTIGGNLSVGAGAELTTVGNFTFRVTGATSITGNLNLGGTSAKTFTGNVIIGGMWNETGSAAVSFAGNLTNNGTYTGGSAGSVTFSGNSVQTLSGSGTIAINNFIINNTNSSVVTTQLGLLPTNNLTITRGRFTIDPQKSVTVNGTLTLNDSIILKSTSAGTASLLTKGTVTGTRARVERYMNGASWSWHFLSSPVVAQGISGGFTPSGAGNGYDFYTWYEPMLTWVNFKNTTVAPIWNTANVNTNFLPGRGYLVAYEATNTTKNFTGKPNSGNINYPLTYGGSSTYQYYNLVGNPYPCAIDWDAVSGWGRGNLSGTQKSYWVWNSASGNYGVYITGSFGLGTNGASNYISSGQGFMVLALSTGNLTMGDGIKANSAQAFLKNEKVSSEELRLKLTCDGNAYSDEALIAFNNNVTDDGSEKFSSIYTDAPELWSVKSGNKYSINFLSDMGSVVPLTVKAGVAGIYTLTASQVESFADYSVISLEDRLEGAFTFLSTNPSYSFKVSEPATIADRFFLHFMDVTGISNTEATPCFSMYSVDGILKIQSLQQIGGKIAVIDMQGRTTATGRIDAGATTQINLNGKTGVYIVSVLTSKGIINTKVLVK